MATMWDVFKIILIVQLFYSFSITIYSHVLPEETLNHVTSFSDLAEDIDLNSVSNDIQESVQDQINIPVVELGALVFYSGNIILDLLLNFFFAIPQMFTLLLGGFLMLFTNIDSFITNTIQIFLSVLVTVLYFLGSLQLLLNLRSGGRSLV